MKDYIRNLFSLNKKPKNGCFKIFWNVFVQLSFFKVSHFQILWGGKIAEEGIGEEFENLSTM